MPLRPGDIMQRVISGGTHCVTNMNQHVLFVDDNPVILKTIETAFAREEYPILLADSGEKALALVEEHQPRVIVTDLRMPGMDGLAFLKHAREINDSWVGMIFSAYMDIDSIMEAVGEEYVWRYIIKPWKDNRELVLAVHNALQYYEEQQARRRAEEQLLRNERLAGLGRLVAGLAHQFNNINVGIAGYTQMAQKYGPLQDEVTECLEKIMAFSKRATEVIKDLTVFTDNSADKGISLCNVSDIASDALMSMQKELDQAGVVVENRFESSQQLHLDYRLIRQVVCNLLENAMHATLEKDRRKVSIQTGEREGRVFIRVIDNGCGIPEKQLSKIFEHFYTTKGNQSPPDSPLANIRGVGLGLSLAQIIARIHNGELTVASEEGKGTEFTLWLPAA